MRQAGRIVSVAVIIAVGVNSDGRREVLGMDIGPSEAETFWTEFLRKLARRGLRGVKLVISDAHEGLKAAIAKVLHATWQRCRGHCHVKLARAGMEPRVVLAPVMLRVGRMSPGARFQKRPTGSRDGHGLQGDVDVGGSGRR